MPSQICPIDFDAVSPALLSLFPSQMPAELRYRAVLNGIMPGKILADSPTNPTWAVVQEAAFGTIYLGGTFDNALVAALVAQLRQEQDVLFGFWAHETTLAALFPPTEYDGLVLEFTDRPALEGLDAYLVVPDGCEVRQVDRALFEQSADYDFNVAFFGSADKAFERLLGLFLMQGEEILAEAFAGPLVEGVIEMGVNTREPYRGRGYATLVCAHLLRTCEVQGYQTYWNCAKQNAASAAIARKLGYRTEREYQLYAWSKES